MAGAGRSALFRAGGMKGSDRLFPLPFTALGITGPLGRGVPGGFAAGAPGCGVRTGGPFLHGTGPTIRFFSVSTGMTMGLGVRFPLVPPAPVAGLTDPFACPEPTLIALLMGLAPITAFAGPEVPGAGGTATAASAGKDATGRGQNETISHTTNPIARDEPAMRIASRSAARLLPGVVCMGRLFWVWNSPGFNEKSDRPPLT